MLWTLWRIKATDPFPREKCTFTKKSLCVISQILWTPWGLLSDPKWPMDPRWWPPPSWEFLVGHGLTLIQPRKLRYCPIHKTPSNKNQHLPKLWDDVTVKSGRLYPGPTLLLRSWTLSELTTAHGLQFILCLHDAKDQNHPGQSADCTLFLCFKDSYI